MADPQSRSAVPVVVAFLLGGIVVAVVAVVWLLFARAEPEPVDVPGVTLEAPKLPDINMPDAPKLPRG